jgi:tetratricopeptide (TPR) repeat protein
VQLVKAGDGTHLWSDQYDRELADIFAIQNEISTAVVDKLRVRLLGKEKTAITRPHLEHFETYRLYLLGRHHWNSRTPTGLQKAIECFNKVLKLDPEYSLAYSGLADCYNLLEQVWLLPPREAYPMAREMAKKALELDGSLAEAHASLGLVRFNYDYNTLTAEQELTTALRLKPNYPTAYHWYALVLASMSRFIEAKEMIRKAIELDPLSPAICTGAVFVEFLARDYDKAVELAENILDLNPEFQFVNLPMAWALAAKGRHEEAIKNHLQVEPSFGHLSEENYKQLKEAFKLNGREGYWSKNAELLEELAMSNYVPPTEIATSYSRLGDVDHVFEWLERAYEVRDSRLRFLEIDQAFDDYRDDPRMDSLLKRIVPRQR